MSDSSVVIDGASTKNETLAKIRALCKEVAKEMEDDPVWLGFAFGFTTKEHGYTVNIQRTRTVPKKGKGT